MRRRAAALWRALLGDRCHLCGSAELPPGRLLCTPCRADLPWLSGPRCPRCAVPLPGAGTDTLCGRCLRRPPRFARAHALCHYAEPLRGLIAAAKFRADLTALRVLRDLLVEAALARRETLPPVLLPVPLHPARLRRRGYNQALELVRPLARHGWTLAPHLARRTAHRPPQSGLGSRTARRRNVRGVFRLADPAPPPAVLLVDDVMTTGATLDELAGCLRAGGVGRVEVLTLARAE